MQSRVGSRQIKIPSWLIPVIGYIISVASLVWVLQGVDLHTVWKDLFTLHWGWVAIAVFSDIAVYVYQAWRWNLLLNPVARIPLWRSVQAIYVGLFTNEVFPLRPGEIIRSYLQARWSGIPFSVAFSSAIIERVFDGLYLIGLFVFTTTVIPLPRVVVDLGKALAVLVGVVAVLLAMAMFWKQRAHRAMPHTRWGMKMRVLIDDLHIMGRSKTFYAALAASTGYLLIQVIPIYALMRAYDLDLSMWAALVVLLILRLGTVVPQAPGNVGASQALMVIALGLFDLNKTTATGLSIVTWAVITLPLLVAGFLALTITGIDLGEIRYHARRHASAPVVRESEPDQEDVIGIHGRRPS
jgi:uncharacterized protein (TIRG00374 family)